MDDVGDDINVDYMFEELDNMDDLDRDDNIKPKKLLRLDNMKCAKILSLRLAWDSVY